MIKVTVSSEIMQVSQVFKSDSRSISYLRKIKRIHIAVGKQKAGIKPLRGSYGRFGFHRYKSDLKTWNMAVNGFPVKVTIENN